MDIRPIRHATALALVFAVVPLVAVAQLAPRQTATPPLQPVLPGATVDTAPSSPHTRLLQRQAADAARDAQQQRMHEQARRQADRAQIDAAIAAGRPIPATSALPGAAPTVPVPVSPVSPPSARARAAELERDAAEARLRRECALRADGTRAAGC